MYKKKEIKSVLIKFIGYVLVARCGYKFQAAVYVDFGVTNCTISFSFYYIYKGWYENVTFLVQYSVVDIGPWDKQTYFDKFLCKNSLEVIKLQQHKVDRRNYCKGLTPAVLPTFFHQNQTENEEGG